jgi:hypothetical protein
LIHASPRLATATRSFSTIDNVASHTAEPRGNLRRATDPQPPPRQQAPPLNGDDEPQPLDLLLIRRLAIKRTVSVSLRR